MTRSAPPRSSGTRRPRVVPGALLLLALAASQPANAGIRVENAWARATPPGMDRGAGYMTLYNTGNDPRVLTGARAADAERIELHESRELNGQMRMEALTGGVTIEPGERVELRPMGIHLMIMGLENRLAVDDAFPLTLEFRNGDTMATELTIRAPGHSADTHSH